MENFWSRLIRIGNELRSGENIELYSVVVASIFLVFLDLFGFANPNWIFSINITILAMLAVSLLGNRHRIEDIQRQLKQTSHDIFLERWPDELFKKSIFSASELFVVGVNLATTTNNYYDKFVDSLKAGRKINFLVVDPLGTANELGAVRIKRGMSASWHKATTIRSLVLMCKMNEQVTTGIEIKTINYIPSFGIFGVDVNTPKGILFIEHYGYKLSSDKPRLVLTPRDGYWYELFREQLVALWNDGTEWKYSREESESIS